MLRVELEIEEMVGRVHGLARVVERGDGDLGRQMKRSSVSVALNVGEGLWAKGGNKRVRVESAMCSGRETMRALRVSAAAGYLPRDAAEAEADRLDRIVAILYKLTYPAGGCSLASR